MQHANWTFTEADEELVFELSSFLPGEVFDAHTHCYRLGYLSSQPPIYSDGPSEVGIETWRREVGRQMGKASLAGGLFSSVPLLRPCDVPAANRFLLEQVRAWPQCRALLVIGPQTRPEEVEPLLDDPLVAGFKPYHTLSTEKPTLQASVGSFIPDWAWELADRRGLIIKLHLVKDRALADPENSSYILEKCRSHPGARLILAHSARGFHAPNMVQSIGLLRGLENVWFDFSAICEAAATLAILEQFGPRRLMWGSDFPICMTRGRCVTLGNGFAWLQPDTIVWEKMLAGLRPVLVGLESLRAFKEAATTFGLNAEDLQDIFCRNAQRLLGMRQESGNLTQDRYERAKRLIPGGTQLLSKRPEMFAPGQWPAYYREARGCETWDLDGRHYYDMSAAGIGACLLGFRDPDVTEAVLRRIKLGSMCTLNPPEEVELAELLCRMHPWAEQARFFRSGGEAAAATVRIARATTDRSVVAFCGYHGWHDWYLAANLGENDALRGHALPGLEPAGVPRELRGTAIPFNYNNRDEFEQILRKHGERLAAVVMEPCRYRDPEPGFLEFVRDGARRCGALLIFDEITIGFRLALGGAHLRYGLNPDMAIFAKALGNGHPIGAVIGTKAAMAGAQGSFISSTYWTEGVGPAAALATLRKMQRVDVPSHIKRIGSLVQETWKRLAAKHRLPLIVPDGFPCLAHCRFDHPQADELRTLFTQSMLEKGFLAGLTFYPTLAHTEEIIGLYAQAVDATFMEIAQALAAGDVKARLKGPVAHNSFRRLL